MKRKAVPGQTAGKGMAEGRIAVIADTRFNDDLARILALRRGEGMRLCTTRVAYTPNFFSKLFDLR